MTKKEAKEAMEMGIQAGKDPANEGESPFALAKSALGDADLNLFVVFMHGVKTGRLGLNR